MNNILSDTLSLRCLLHFVVTFLPFQRFDVPSLSPSSPLPVAEANISAGDSEYHESAIMDDNISVKTDSTAYTSNMNRAVSEVTLSNTTINASTSIDVSVQQIY